MRATHLTKKSYTVELINETLEMVSRRDDLLAGCLAFVSSVPTPFSDSLSEFNISPFDSAICNATFGDAAQEIVLVTVLTSSPQGEDYRYIPVPVVWLDLFAAGMYDELDVMVQDWAADAGREEAEYERQYAEARLRDEAAKHGYTLCKKNDHTLHQAATNTKFSIARKVNTTISIRGIQVAAHHVKSKAPERLYNQFL